MSVFLAVDLDAPSRAEAVALVQTHRAMVAGKWLRPDKLHCTLVFLGHPGPEQVALWGPVLDALALRHRPFRLRLTGAGTFVTARAPSVLWLGVGGELEALTALHLEALAALQVQERPFVPHVTLARAQVPGAFEPLARELAGFVSSDFRVNSLSLYESSAEVYRVLRSSPLPES